MKKGPSYVVAVDYSEPSAAALQEAARLAAGAGAHLTVVHVVLDEELAFAVRSTGLSPSDILTGRRLRLDRFCLETLGTRTIPSLRLEIIQGHPFAEVLRQVELERAALLVLGASGESHQGPANLGTLASSCVRHAPCETLLVRSSVADGFQTIVVAVDFSERSQLALRRAGEIARADGSQIHLLHVYAPAWKHAAIHGGPLHVDSVAEKAYLDRIQRKLTDFVMQELPGLSGRAATISTRECFSRAAGIVDYLVEVKADLVVLGGKPHRPSDLGNLGVTAEYMIHDSPCSVLTMRPEESTVHVAPRKAASVAG